jgi:hypothetical protein
MFIMQISKPLTLTFSPEGERTKVRGNFEIRDLNLFRLPARGRDFDIRNSDF